MEEFVQSVDVEPLTAWERVEYFLATLRRHWPGVLISFVLLSLWGLQYSETSAVIMFLVGVMATIIFGFPRTRDIYAYRANERNLAGDFGSAVTDYRQALAVALAKYPQITTDMGQITRRVDRFYADTLYSLGTLYCFLNRPVEARTVFESALEVRPNDPLLLTGLGRVLLLQECDKDAQIAFDKALASVPRTPRSQNIFQRVAHSLKAVMRGVGWAWVQHADAFTIYVLIGDAYTGAGKYREAIAAYEQAFALNPQSPVPQHGLGNAYHGLGHYDEAIAAYQRALAGRGRPAKYRAITYHNLGEVLLYQERFSEAQAALEQAVALNRRMGLGYVRLAYVYAEQGQYERALEQCQHASSLTPSSPATYICLGRIYADQGRYEEAISELERAMDLERHTGWAWLERARLETLRGDTEAALEYLTAALERGPRQAIRRRALEEKKLRPLHDHPRFRELVGESEEERPTAT